MSAIVTSEDGQKRCKWAASVPEFIDYHDTEWGFPVGDDIRLFEKLCLESFQSGLSWRTILAKRENFRRAFMGFDFNKIADFTDADITRLLSDEGIVRHRGKIQATINNAKKAQKMVAEMGSLSAYFWRYEPSFESMNEPQTQSTSDVSKAIAKDLKKRGWKFVGPTTVYAFMQAMGLINDHDAECIIRSKAEKARQQFKRPQLP
ncbi:DNA-3-methyladenine glycosylase I [Pseudoalteromonas luteoviolacea]|uniref:DNA-3-methyladenine glycosylase I n=1 Tax=Pseudoalteromonas luteoviolacea TaxID=43657 RepID=UPI001B3A2873|nr:DNA-3-methyladenine glycosylase I [Pseudoalteromonas luteoviolacea]MBQ4879957.1 DNA-3-methyladenine glycosylase I [Pseudoalteromonas luteoviolacea]MBQ4908974.1 DNA-3-methyladenine glycosylase I [Pseudoalteromonas luteoviolacea]